MQASALPHNLIYRLVVLVRWLVSTLVDHLVSYFIAYYWAGWLVSLPLSTLTFRSSLLSLRKTSFI